jgi:hypothetical protein
MRVIWEVFIDEFIFLAGKVLDPAVLVTLPIREPETVGLIVAFNFAGLHFDLAEGLDNVS